MECSVSTFLTSFFCFYFDIVHVESFVSFQVHFSIVKNSNLKLLKDREILSTKQVHFKKSFFYYVKGMFGPYIIALGKELQL